MPSTPYKGYALIDCNNFFVSCERIFRPDLDKKPVVVLSTNDGCIISRSQEVKNLKVPMGAPLFQYQELLKNHNVTIFSCNFELYGDLSDRVMQTISLFSPDLEIYSIDEAFLPLTNQNMESLLELRAQILKWTGIPVSIGVGPTKTLAKAANYCAKKVKTPLFSLMDKDKQNRVLKKIEVCDIWGIGKRMAKKLKGHTIQTAYQLKIAPEAWIRSHFKLPGLRTVLELQGRDCYTMPAEDTKRKSLVYSKSFGRIIKEYSELKEAVSSYASRAAFKIRKKKYLAQMLSLYLKQRESSWIETAALAYPSDSSHVYIQTAQKLLKKAYRSGAYLKVGIYLSGLTSSENQNQFDLFHQEDPKSKKLMQVFDSINYRYGKNTLFFATEGLDKKWQTKSEHRTPFYTTRWEDLLTISI